MIRVNTEFDPLLRRPFSICAVPDDNIICILYRVVGKGTTILSRKKEGEYLSVLGPLGKCFEPPEIDKKALLVGGGIGVAPLLFLAQTMKERGFEFMAGFRTSGEIIDRGETGFFPNNISLATDDGSEGHAGPVTGLLEEYMSRKPDQTGSLSIFSCGPSPMLKKVVSIAADLNITCQVSMEAAMACGLGVCQGCAVRALSPKNHSRYYHVCKDGPVFIANSIDWSSI
jgi:dihydroorotate dehydrogenase electron transfer subunit